MKYLLLPKYHWLRHLVYISFICTFWLLYGWRYIVSLQLVAILQLAAYAFSYVIVIYFNLQFLMPRLLYRNKIWQYLVITYCTFVVGYVIQDVIYVENWNEFAYGWRLTEDNVLDRARDMGINAITFIMFLAVGWAFRTFKMWLTGEQRIQQLQAETLQAELSNLKNQVNPHFLFNTFNSLYVTSKTSPEKVPDMILDLADLMRYQLEECSREKVPLKSEISYIKNFIGIEKVRKDKAEIKFSVKGKTDGIMVEPLLFVTLVENAFKHGLGKLEDGYVFITFSTRNGNELHLTVKNNKPAGQLNGKIQGHGIGLANLKKRLHLGYPGRHRLEIVETEDEFIANLQLQV
ncbi:MAG TPA: histidine kinase [Bacteroidia bacterium]|nr:histidine kinase [Bacteroidia bacterium]